MFGTPFAKSSAANAGADMMSAKSADSQMYKGVQEMNAVIGRRIKEDEKSPAADLYNVLSDRKQNQKHQYHYQKRRPQNISRVAPSQPLGGIPGTFKRIPKGILDQPFLCARQFGMFSEIDRVWVSVDNTLYLWHYTSANGNSWDIYDGLDQVIVSVALVRPKPGVFDHQYVKHSSTVEYLLVIATTVEIVVLTVSFRGIGPSGRIEIHSSGYTIPSDDISMHHIVGTPNGRIFMGGRDGNLYELHYRRTTGFMSMVGLRRDCWIENHTMSALPQLVPLAVRHKLTAVAETVDLKFDKDRQILYLLVEEDSEGACCGSARKYAITRSVIHAFYLGSDGCSMIRLKRTPLAVMDEARSWASKSRSAGRTQLRNIFSQRTTMSRRNRDEQLCVRKLVVVRPSESHKVHLMAISERGIRLYFATSDVNSGRYGSSWGRASSSTTSKSAIPSKLSLVYVRMPPPIVREADVVKSGREPPVEVELYKPVYSKDIDAQVAFYSHGVLLLPLADQGRNSLVSITPHDATLAEIRQGAGGAGIDMNGAAASAAAEQRQRIGTSIVGTAAFLPGVGTYNHCRYGLQECVSFLGGRDIGAGGSRILDIAEVPFYDGVATAAPGMRSGGIGDCMTKNIRDHILNEGGTAVGVSANGVVSSLGNFASASNGKKRTLNALYGDTGRVADAKRKGALKGGGDALVLSPLAAQMCRVQRPHDLIVLTAKGLRRVHRYTAVEQMQEALSTCPVSVASSTGDEGLSQSSRLTDLFNIYGYDEACAMCLQIACTENNMQLARSAAVYAGVDAATKTAGDFPVELVTQASRAGTSPADRVRRCASDALQVFGGVCQISDPSLLRRQGAAGVSKPTTSGAVGLFQTQHSFRFNGLCIYVARLLRPFWTHTITIPSSTMRGNDVLRECRFDSDELALLQEPLRCLCNFMKRSPLFAAATKMDRTLLYDLRNVGADGVSAPNLQDRFFDKYLSTHSDARVSTERKAKLHEQRKIHFIYLLLCRAKEALALFRILLTPNGNMQHKSKSLNGVLSRIPRHAKKRVLDQLSRYTWAFLVTQHSGKELMSELVEATIAGETAEEAARMARRLTSECSCFYTQIEQSLLGVEERLKFAKESSTLASSEQALSMSEQILVEAAKQLRERVRRHGSDELSQTLEGVVAQYMKRLGRACEVFVALGAVERIQKVALKAGAMFASCTNDDITRPSMDVSAADGESRAAAGNGDGIDLLPSASSLDSQHQRLRTRLRSARKQCYEIVIASLRTLMEGARELPQTSKAVTQTLGFAAGIRASGAKFTDVQRRQQADVLLNLSLQSNDRWFHEMMYDWFFVELGPSIPAARRDQVLTANTRYHRDYLHQYARQLLNTRPPAPVSTTSDGDDATDGGDVYTFPLIYKFFQKNKMDLEASDILRNLAMFDGSVGMGSERYPLRQRMHYLVRSQEHLRRVAQDARGDVVRMLQNVKDDVDIARRQQHVLRRMTNLFGGPDAPESKKRALQKLRYELLDVTTLYNDFARPNHLWEDCIAILHECNHRNDAELQRVWCGLLEDNGDVEKLLGEMGRRYYVSQRSFTFPVEFICGYLETRVSRGFKPSNGRFPMPSEWVVRMMRGIPVSFEDLLDVYLNLRKRASSSLHKVRLLLALGALFRLWYQFLQRPGADDAEKLYVRTHIDRLTQHIQATMSELTHHAKTVDGSLDSYIRKEIGEMRMTCDRFRKFCREPAGASEMRLYYGFR